MPRAVFLSVLLLFVSAAALCSLTAADCNGNGAEDVDDIELGDSEDCNENGVPDECEAWPLEDLVPDDPLMSVGFLRGIIELEDRFEPHSSALEDLDHDGWLDMVTMDGEDRVMFLRGDQSGGLVPETIYTLDGTSEILWITVADVDGDGFGDVLAVDESTDNLAVLINDGDGGFDQTDDLVDVGARPSFVVAADFDGDDDLDIVVADLGDQTFALLQNRGDGTFRDRVVFDVGHRTEGAATGDFDGDGTPDIAVAGGSYVSVLLNDGEGGFGEALRIGGESPRYVYAGDLDGDGDLDLAVASTSDQRVGLLENDGDGVFGLRDPVGLARGPRSVILADLDGNGLLDLITGNERSDSVSIALNRGDWSFDTPRVEDVGADPRFVVAGDLDRDGDNDVVVANHSSHDLTLLYVRRATIYEPPFLDRVCTPLELHSISVSALDDGAADSLTCFLVPVDVDDSAVLPPMLPNARYGSMPEFLDAVFPDLYARITEERYEEIISVRATRVYFTGAITRYEIDDEVFYGFRVLTDGAEEEQLSFDEVRYVYDALTSVLLLEPVVYVPRTRRAREAASLWEDPPFPVRLTSDRFRRGDVGGDGLVGVDDPIALFEFLFTGGESPSCLKTADANDDGSIDVADGVAILLHLFAGVAGLPGPSARCGIDPTSDTLGCARFDPCDATQGH
jgi:hypothetical protein